MRLLPCWAFSIIYRRIAQERRQMRALACFQMRANEKARASWDARANPNG
jgi:hypothetical protein